MTQKHTTALRVLLLCCCTAGVFAIRFAMLNKTPEPAGLDGYYYALQAKSLIERGKLENPDYKTGYYLCGGAALVCGDPITGCKAVAALMSALLCLGVYAVLGACGVPGRCCLAGFFLCGASFAAASMAVNYINNLTGLAFFLFYAALLIRLCRAEKNRSKAARACAAGAAALLFLLCVLSHLVSAAYAFLSTIILLLRKQTARRQLLILAAAMLPGTAAIFRELPRFAKAFSAGPVLPVLSPFMRRMAGTGICGEMSVLFIAVWGICGFYALRLAKRCQFDAAVLAAPILFFPFWNLTVLDMGYRMLLSAVPCGIVILMLGIQKALRRTGSIRSALCAAALCLAVITAPASVQAYDPALDPPYAYYRQVVRHIELPDDSLLIAHLGLNHVYTYYKNLRDSLNYVPDFPVPAEKLWRLAFGVHIISLEHNLADMSREEFERYVHPIDAQYTLIREDIWQRYLANEEEAIARTYDNWFNPHTARPQFIRKTR